MKLLPLALLACTLTAGAQNLLLKQVQSVYILPMGSGMDQYLANKIARDGLFQVVTDPQKADAILTDRIGEPFEQKLTELYPPPKPEKPPEPPPKKESKDVKDGEDKDKDKDKDKDAAATPPAKTDQSDSAKLMAAAGTTTHASSFGRGKGTFFLVDRKSRMVIWSTYDRPRDNSADTLDKKANQVVSRLRRDLKETK